MTEYTLWHTCSHKTTALIKPWTSSVTPGVLQPLFSQCPPSVSGSLATTCLLSVVCSSPRVSYKWVKPLTGYLYLFVGSFILFVLSVISNMAGYKSNTLFLFASPGFFSICSFFLFDQSCSFSISYSDLLTSGYAFFYSSFIGYQICGSQ